MQLGQRGWLQKLLKESIASHRIDSMSQSLRDASKLSSGRARARRYLRGYLRESGLLFGTPSTREHFAKRNDPPEEALFIAVLQTFSRLALDIAALVDAAPGPRAEQILVLLAALIHRTDEAEDIHRRIENITRQWPLPEKVWKTIEVALEERAQSLTADPYYGLVLHNGAIYADASVFGRLAIFYFSSHTFDRQRADRWLEFAAAQKSRLVEVLVSLVCAERPPSFPTRRAILRQIEDLRLPAPLGESTLDFARRAFDKPPSIKHLARDVRSRDLRRFILEQTVLAALVDGRRSPREVEWTQSLGNKLGFSAEQLKDIELSMAAFYRQHRHVLDVFTLSAGAEVMGEEWVDTMSAAVKKNYRALLREIRETGELSVLLARAASGKKLNADEKSRMRRQLIDVAKAVPALAIFAAPGGALLLIALAKVLPFDLLPSAFQPDSDNDGDRPAPMKKAPKKR